MGIAGSSTVQDLPGVLRTPLSEPLFILGTLFILVVFFLPGGIAGVASRGPRRKGGLAMLEAAVGKTGDEEEPGAQVSEARP